MIKNNNWHDAPLQEDIKDFTQDELTKIIRKFESLQYGYTTFGDVIQLVSEQLDIPENIAEWMINHYRKVYNENN